MIGLTYDNLLWHIVEALSFSVYVCVYIYIYYGSINPRAPSIPILPSVGPEVYKHDLRWAIWSLFICHVFRKPYGLA